MTAAKPRAGAKQKPICHLRIGFTDLLIDADKGLQVIKLLSECTECDVTYEGLGYSYVIKAPPTLSMEMVNKDSVRAPTSGRRHLALGHEQD